MKVMTFFKGNSGSVNYSCQISFLTGLNSAMRRSLLYELGNACRTQMLKNFV